MHFPNFSIWAIKQKISLLEGISLSFDEFYAIKGISRVTDFAFAHFKPQVIMNCQT